MKKIIQIGLSVLLFTACSDSVTTEKSNSYKLLDATEFSNILKETPDATLIDVRTAEEYKEGHIANSINAPVQSETFNELLSTLDKSKPVFVYCLSGGRSSSAASILQEHGFKEIIELKSGMLNWRANNFSEESGSATSPKKVSMSLSEYKSITEKDPIVLVDFNATWCAPCKKIDVILKKIEKEYAGKVTIVKVDIDQHAELAKNLSIASIPLLKVYKDGKETWEHLGLVDEQTLKKALN